MVKNLPANEGDAGFMGLIPGSGRSPEIGNTIHSSVLAVKIPWREEPGRLQPVGSQRVGYNRATNTDTHTPSNIKVHLSLKKKKSHSD